MNLSASPVPGVFHFLQHNTVSSHDWQRIGQAITTAYQQLCQRPDTLGLATAPVICEYTGKKPYPFDESLIGLGVIGFNGKGPATWPVIPLCSTDVRHPMLLYAATRGAIPTSGW